MKITSRLKSQPVRASQYEALRLAEIAASTEGRWRFGGSTVGEPASIASRRKVVNVTAKAAVGAVVALVLAGCGTGSSMSSGSDTVPSSAVSVSNPSTMSQLTVLADDRLGLDVITADTSALPSGEIEDGGCGWMEEAYGVTLASEVFSGRPVRLGERGMTPDALGRVVEIEVVEVYVDGVGHLESGQPVSVFVPDTQISLGHRYEVPGVDLDQVMSRDVVTVFGVADVGGFVRPVRVLSESDDGLSFNGYCDHEGDVLAEIADRLGSPDVLSMLVQFSEANAQGEGISALREAFEQWRSDRDAANAPPPWEDQDPATRPLDPHSVPDGLLSSLDVLGVSFALDDLADADAVGVRTESGISGSLIGASAMPFVGPLYFLRDVDETVDVFVQSVSSDAEPQLVASVELAAIVEAGGGIEISGSVRDGTVTISTLTREQMADRLAVEPEQLDQLRTNYLSR